jgi:nicotinate-nucleotide adenylyltransferase
MEQVKKIGLLGGSFNPPHLGHIQICKFVFEQNLCDEIWIVPCFEHPFGKLLAHFEERIKMCRLAFEDFGENVKVLELEKKLGGTSHTVRTIEHIKLQHPDVKFGLIVGSDISEEKDDWKDFARIEELVDIVEIPRGKNSPIIDISSTEIRDLIKSDKQFDQYVTSSVANYISENSLYKD